jgi:hypothetical protein
MSWQIAIHFQQYWHAGSGRGSGFVADSLVLKKDGLPIFPGKTLRGLLRDAVVKAEAWGFYQDLAEKDLADRLFGQRDVKNLRYFSLLRVGNAELSKGLQEKLLKQKQVIANLYQNIYQTAINLDRGVAEEKSLRGMEVTVPLTLYATVEQRPSAELTVIADATVEEIFTRALPLIRALGSNRSRGLGRASLTFSKI